MNIPAGTMVLPLFEEIFKGDHWRDGRAFRPERFIGQDGNIKTDAHCIPFSTGKRKCIGEKLAKTEMLIIFSTLVQHFQIFAVNDVVEQNETGFINIPKSFEIKLQRRCEI